MVQRVGEGFADRTFRKDVRLLFFEPLLEGVQD
ncbi:MAG: hypothetical protein ACI92S_001828, partial [Planctomycetaceae bacterium]